MEDAPAPAQRPGDTAHGARGDFYFTPAGRKKAKPEPRTTAGDDELPFDDSPRKDKDWGDELWKAAKNGTKAVAQKIKEDEDVKIMMQKTNFNDSDDISRHVKAFGRIILKLFFLILICLATCVGLVSAVQEMLFGKKN